MDPMDPVTKIALALATVAVCGAPAMILALKENEATFWALIAGCIVGGMILRSIGIV